MRTENSTALLPEHSDTEKSASFIIPFLPFSIVPFGSCPSLTGTRYQAGALFTRAFVIVECSHMERKIVSKSGNSSSEGDMSTQALSDAKTWLEVLHDEEFRGRKDTDGAARYRLASRLGVKENYLFRLQYRAAEMKDVAGEVYRRLGLAYADMCERNEKAADAYRAERLQMKAERDAVDQKPGQTGKGSGPAHD